MSREICVIIMMGERGQENIQTNLESFVNLQKLTETINLKKSSVIIKPGGKNTPRNVFLSDPTKFKSSSEIKSKTLVDNTWNLSDIKFLKNKKNTQTLNKEEQQFEEALNQEKERRENPLDILGDYILRIQTLCKRLMKVNLQIYLFIDNFRNLTEMT